MWCICLDLQELDVGHRHEKQLRTRLQEESSAQLAELRAAAAAEQARAGFYLAP